MSTQSTPYLTPIEKPKGLMLRMGYRWSKKEFGKVFSPLAVFCARMPAAFTRFYTTIGKLDKKLEIDAGLRGLIRERVASLNGCAFCMDSNRFAALREGDGAAAKLDALADYGESPLFDARERAALDYVTELTREHDVAPSTFEALARHFSEREICDIVYVVGSEHVFNLTNLGLGIGSDGLCEMPAAAKAAALMLGRKDYTRKELDDGRARIDAQLRTLAEFEADLFVNLLLALDRLYVHRLRSSTGKDGNPLNEVELIVESLLNNDGVFRVDNKSIKWKPEESVTGLATGDRIELDRPRFEALYGAFMADLEAKFIG